MKAINKQVFFLFFLLITAWGFNANAQTASVSARIDSTQILIGQQTALRLFVHAPVSQKVIFPVLKDSLAKGIQVVGLTNADTIKDAQQPGMQTIRRTYTITSFDAGDYTIPSIAVSIVKDTLHTEPLSLKVISVKVDTTKAFYDIKQPISVSYTFIDWLRDNWYWVAGAVLLIAVIIGVIIYLKKRPAPQPVIEEVRKPVVSPHIIALNKLNELKGKKLWQQDNYKEYHIELSDIIREYIELRYRVKTHEKTTAEIFSGLQSAGIPPQNWEQLQQILSLADLVKFAKYIPISVENEQSMDNAVAFVTETRPVYEAPQHKEGGPANGLA